MEQVQGELAGDDIIAVISDIRKKYKDVTFPDVEIADTCFQRMNPGESDDDIPFLETVKMEHRKAIISSYKGNISDVAICSEEYKLIPHELAIWEFERMMADHPEFPISDGLNVRFYGNYGNRMIADFKTPLSKEDIKVGDPVEMRAGISNSIDLTRELRGYFSAERLVCTNGMTASFMNTEISRKHRKCLNVRQHMQVIGENVHLLSDQFGIWKKWATIEMNRIQATEILEALPFGSKYQEQILQLTERGTKQTLNDWLKRDRVNAWDLNNVVTQFITHEVEAENASLNYQDEVSAILHKRFETIH